jgi:predicted dehydrogenase
MPTSISAVCHEGKWHDIEVEDDVTAYAEFEGGATGAFITSTGETPGTNRFELSGDNGKLVCEDDTLTFHKLSVSEQEFSETNRKPFGKPECEKINIEHGNEAPGHSYVIKAFADKILGKGELVADGREGINGLMISNAMHLSSWLGKPVGLPIDEELFYSELMKRVRTSKIKENVESVIAVQ